MQTTKDTLVINIFGAPCSGKSTLAMRVCNKLKRLGYEAEYVGEFAKAKVWEGNETALSDQIFIFANQLYMLNVLNKKVDFIVTDSPILLSEIYNQNGHIQKEFSALIHKTFETFDNYNIVIKRNKDWNQNGRVHTMLASISISDRIDEMLANHKYSKIMHTNKGEAYESIIDYAREWVGGRDDR